MEVKKTVSLEINGKTYNFRFYKETRCGDPEKTICEQFCPLSNICDKTPDPRYYIDPKKYDGSSLNDFCLIPYGQVYDAVPSVILTLHKHAGQIVSKDQLLKYLNSEDSIDRCVRLDLIKETGDGNFKIISDFLEWSKKEHLLADEDRKFIYSNIGDDRFLEDLIPFQEDVEKYIKEVVDVTETKECNLQPFDLVLYKPTNEEGLVKRVAENGVFVLFRIQSTAQLCKFEDIEKL